MVFCHLTEYLVINTEKKLIDTATKTGIDAAKLLLKELLKKTAEATEDFIGTKIADNITSIGKSKEKGETMKVEEIYILTKKSKNY